MPVFTHAIAAEESHKGEDAPAAFEHPDGVAAFAIFDGHGGKNCSHPCASLKPEGVLPRLLSGGKLPTVKMAEDVFWTVDALLGEEMAARGDHGGSTATVLAVEPQGPALSCLLAWVGDSTACTVDMRAQGPLSMHHTTQNHSPDVEAEAASLHYLADVYHRIYKDADRAAHQAKKAAKQEKKAAAEAAEAAAGRGDDDEDGGEGGGGGGEAEATAAEQAQAAQPEKPLPTPEVVGAALKAMGKPHGEAEVRHVLRAFERERLVGKCILGSDGQPKGGRYRRNVCIYRRPAKKDPNRPLCIATHEDPYSSHHRDLQMTRSICDWTKTVWILPHPQTRTFTVEPGAHLRLILASDGLWDVVGHEQAASLARKAESADEAAKALLAAAHHVYIDVRGLERPGDDTTVLVVDLNPSELPLEPWAPKAAVGIRSKQAAAGAGGPGCCVAQ